MLLSFAYIAFSAVLRLLVSGRPSEVGKDVELLVLQHQLVSAGKRGVRGCGQPIVRCWWSERQLCHPGERKRSGFGLPLRAPERRPLFANPACGKN
jgi:hypothetical protein